MANFGELNTDTPVWETLKDLEAVFRKWGDLDWGAPRENMRTPLGPASVWFTLNGQRKELTCSRWPEYQRNIRALYLTLESLRLASQRGILDQYRQFFAELPAGAGDAPSDDPWTVLGVTKNAAAEVVETAYRRRAFDAHPDRGGSDAAMRRLNVARDAIRSQAAAGSRGE